MDIRAIKKIFQNFLPVKPKKAFYIIVKCSDCEEEVRVRIDRASDFQVTYDTHNPEHYYTIKKEMIGKNCYNLMELTLALTRDAKVLFANTKTCEFIKLGRG